MSMNIMISATRKISFTKKNGQQCTDTQTIVMIGTVQTPTKETYKIINSADQAQAYIDYVTEFCSEDIQVPIYGEDDDFGEFEPVRFDTYNYGKEHIAQFKEWMSNAIEDGYTIEFSVC